MPNTAEWPIVLLGGMEAGLLISTANPFHTAGKYTDTAHSTVGRHDKLLLREMATQEEGARVFSVAYRKRESAY
jgi:hypothetical protein